MTRARVAVGALALVLLAGCGEPAPAQPGERSSTSATSAPSSAPRGTAAPASTPAEGFAGGRAQHTIRSRGMVVDVTYAAPSPARWAADGGVPVQVDVSVRNRNQKIYLIRATMRFLVSDGEGALPSPDPLVDSANLTPGYLVTAPSSYVHSFTVPPVDRAASDLTMIMKLELVSLVDRGAKDYSKLTVTDTLTTAVSP